MGKIILNGTEYAGSGGSSGGSGGHTIVDPTGTDMPQENKLQFTGAVNVSDDSVNGQTVVDIEGGVIYLPTIYSDEEREVGVWRDGKPLYQKTAYVQNISISANSDTNINISDYFVNIDSVVCCECSSGDSIFPNIMASSGLSPYSIGVTIDKGSNHITFSRGSGGSATISVYITLRYTKTTDTAGSGAWTPSGANAVHYSTNEQVIGTWIDGKPLYEKTISFGSLPNNTQKNVAHGISDVDLIVKCEGIAYDSSYKSISVPYSNVDSLGYQLQLEVNRTNVSIKAKINFTGYIGYITLQYTKTTD